MLTLDYFSDFSLEPVLYEFLELLLAFLHEIFLEIHFHFVRLMFEKFTGILNSLINQLNQFSVEELRIHFFQDDSN